MSGEGYTSFTDEVEDQAVTSATGAEDISLNVTDRSDKKLPDYSFDLCIVFNIGDANNEINIPKHLAEGTTPKSHNVSDFKTKTTVNEQVYFKQTIVNLVKVIQGVGLKVRYAENNEKSRGFLMIGATEERLKVQADLENYTLAVSGKGALEYALTLPSGVALASEATSEEPEYSEVTPALFDGMYFTYDGDAKLQQIYAHYDDEGSNHPNTLFRQTDRIKLTTHILEGPKRQGCAELMLDTMQANPTHPVAEVFPLHAPARLQTLAREWNFCNFKKINTHTTHTTQH